MIRAAAIWLSLLANAALGQGMSAARVADTCGGASAVVDGPVETTVARIGAQHAILVTDNGRPAQGDTDRTRKDPAGAWMNLQIAAVVGTRTLATPILTPPFPNGVYVVATCTVDGSDPRADFCP